MARFDRKPCRGSSLRQLFEQLAGLGGADSLHYRQAAIGTQLIAITKWVVEPFEQRFEPAFYFQIGGRLGRLLNQMGSLLARFLESGIGLLANREITAGEITQMLLDLLLICARHRSQMLAE